MTRRTALAGGGAALLATALAACGESSDDNAASNGSAGAGNFPETPKYRFVFVNHVTTNPFFVPTQYGAEDACALLKCKFQWTGSETANVSEMVNAFNTAIAGNADGIAIAHHRPEGVQRADRQGARGRHPGLLLQRRRPQ
jgi:simple sugar transport system substrate-binding protein